MPILPLPPVAIAEPDVAADTRPQTGLILTGGGARAAYQVGVLQALVELLDPDARADFKNPFPILCGTSAGAINAAALACRATQPRHAVAQLRQFWATLHTDQIYRADMLGLLRTGAHWLGMLSLGWLVPGLRRRQPLSLLDNRPLEVLLREAIDFEALAANLSAGAFSALAVMASSYASGEHLTFYQSHTAIKPWSRTQRRAIPTPIGIDHLMASSALPFVFAARPVKLNGHLHWCGDGSMRQLTPIGPAIHLGASRVVVIGTALRGDTHPERNGHEPSYPSLAQIGGHALSTIFLDSVAADVERLESINALLEYVPPGQGLTALRKVEVLLLSPTRSFDDLALEHLASMPKAARRLLRVLGVSSDAGRHGGGALLSYILFESGYTRALIELGYLDTMQRSEAVLNFFKEARA